MLALPQTIGCIKFYDASIVLNLFYDTQNKRLIIVRGSAAGKSLDIVDDPIQYQPGIINRICSKPFKKAIFSVCVSLQVKSFGHAVRVEQQPISRSQSGFVNRNLIVGVYSQGKNAFTGKLNRLIFLTPVKHRWRVPGAGKPQINDDFGYVFGFLLAVTGDPEFPRTTP